LDLAMVIQETDLHCSFCIMTIHNLANGYQQLEGMSSSCLRNTGMYLPKYMAPHHQTHSKTMKTILTNYYL